ncbi:hypothetical protein BASA81_005765 [Batrachochytrium salamandrivorans]|nr:hypothetical protein BASA81_005765 [Batrachochytrium salamandrivorans]
MATDVAEFVREVFTGKDQTKYQDLLRMMREGEDESQVIELLRNIRLFTSVLGQRYEEYNELLEMLFSFDWGVSDAVVEEFEEILIALNLANAAFLEETFGLICRNFTAGNTLEGGEIGDAGHLHELIRRVLRVTPLGCSALLNVLIRYFPQKQNSGPIGVQCMYFKEALRVTEYVPVLRDKIVGVAMERILDLDIELAFQEDEGGGEIATVEVKRARVGLDDMEVKLDSLLGVLLDYFDTSLKKPLAFKSILLQFEKLVLRTRRSRCTQFLVFYCCSTQSKPFADLLIHLLMNKIKDLSEDVATRRYAAGYLASFLARANFLSLEQVQMALAGLVEWLVGKHEVGWEAAFQAVIYTLIFKSFMLGEGYMPQLDGWTAFYNKHCTLLPKDLAHEYALLLGDKPRKSSGGEGMAMIDFPFDPLVLLEQTWKRVEPGFQFWQHVDEDEDDDEACEFTNQDFESDIEFEVEEESSSDSDSDSSDEDDSSQGEEEEEEDEFADFALLDAVLPKAIQLQRIERMLINMTSAHSPHGLRPYLAAVPALPPIPAITARKRSLSTGSW